jgi:hypothetical protein
MEVSCLPCHRRSWSPCGSRSPRCCQPARSITRWAATAPASPTGSSSTSSSRCWCSAAATAASPITPAPPPRCGAAATSGSPSGGRAAAPGRAGRLRPAVRLGDRALGRRRVHHQGTLRRRGRRSEPGGPRQARPEALDRHRIRRHPAGCGPAAANRRDDGLLAATLDTVATLGVLPAQPVVHLDAGYDYQTCRQVLVERAMVGQIATRGVPGTSPGGPPLAGRAHPRVGQPLRQAALVHRTPPAGGRVLVGAGQRRHRAWSIGASRLGLLPLGRPPTTTAITPTGAGSAMLRWTLARRGEVLSTRTGLTGQAKCCRYNL